MDAVRKGYLLEKLKYRLKKVDINIYVFANTHKPVFYLEGFLVFLK